MLIKGLGKRRGSSLLVPRNSDTPSSSEGKENLSGGEQVFLSLCQSLETLEVACSLPPLTPSAPTWLFYNTLRPASGVGLRQGGGGVRWGRWTFSVVGGIFKRVIIEHWGGPEVGLRSVSVLVSKGWRGRRSQVGVWDLGKGRKTRT